MCGIAGIWSPDLSREERERWMHSMLAALRHRGPSGRAVWSDAEVTLGITRLAIVAPESEADVAAGDAGHLRAVMNGEIYNHSILRGALRVQGHAVAGPTDTWVLPPLYEREGIDFPRRLDGMFAIALWDAQARRLVLARDRAGEKPLFIARVPGGWAFASEPAALSLLPWISRDPSPEALSRYLLHGFFAGADSAYAAIRQLPPAHTLELSNGVERTRRYWSPWEAIARDPRPSASVAEAPAKTRERLEAAVASRVPDEVPFGVFLSGGVDSGLVATLAARAVGHSFPTFSLRLPHEGYDESGFAAGVARSIRAEHHVIEMGAAEGAEALDTYAATLDQPLGDPSLLPTWALARLASRHVPVVLTGEGGDELFAGYPTYLGHAHAALARRLPRALRQTIIALARRARPAHHHVTIPLLIERFLSVGELSAFERHWAWFGTASSSEATGFLAPPLRANLAERAPLAHVDRMQRVLENAGLWGGGEPPLVAYQLLDFELYLSGALLTKVDRAAMAHGVESRAPFLQQSLIEFALALPAEARLRGRTSKWALKEAARDLLPAALLRRRKQGFSPPFSAWARGPLRGSIEAHLSQERIERAGVLDPVATRALVREHVEGRVERGRTLWTLLSLQMWAERRAAQSRPETPAFAAPDVSVARMS